MLFRPASLLKPNNNIKVEITYIDVAKQAVPGILQEYVLEIKDAFHLALLHKAICWR